VLPLNFLLRLYFQSIDPLSLNKQGGDVGTQYRTGIYYLDDADLPIISQALADLIPEVNHPPVVEVGKVENYYLAEEYHQRYLQKNPDGYCHIPPLLFAKARQAKAYPRAEQKELKERLTPLQYMVTQEDFTEPPFTNEYWDFFDPGIYVDITNDDPLFASADKFKCTCGWASFSKPIDFAALVEQPDITHGMNRVEVRSKNADSHLGHVFQDGPQDRGGLRYCINSAAIRFVPLAEMAAQGYEELVPLVQAAVDKKT
jgi:peptide methionine sulfoxide reductase msrA/msrB